MSFLVQQGPEPAWRRSIVLPEHVGKSSRALEAGLAGDLLDRLLAIPKSVNRDREAALDQIGVRRSLSCRAEAANEMVSGDTDQTGKVTESDVATDVGIDVGEDPIQVAWRQWPGCSLRCQTFSAILRNVRMPTHQMSN